LLNPNVKVPGVAEVPGVEPELVQWLLREGHGVIQLPCPEVEHLGLKRPRGEDVKEQYDTTDYRAVCASIAGEVVRRLTAHEEAGYRVVGIIGVDGSPSCSVTKTPRRAPEGSKLSAEPGIFMEELQAAMARAGKQWPFVGYPESRQPEAMAAFARALARLP
jgi:predicted secreted protein